MNLSVKQKGEERETEKNPTHLNNTHTCRWLERADFYDDEWFPGIQYFDSWEELVGTEISEWHLMLRI